MKVKNEMLLNENKAVKEVNAKLRDMAETRVPYVATPPAPLPAEPYGPGFGGPLGWAGYGWSGYGRHPWAWHDGASPAMRIKSRVVETG